MSVNHPIIAITGSSGAGTTSFLHVFEKIFRRSEITANFIHGSAFRRYTPSQLGPIFRAAAEIGQPISHFGPEANLLNRLESLFCEYSRRGTGLSREYISNEVLAQEYGGNIGDYTPWQELSPDSDLLFYEGQHGGSVQATWSRRKMSESHNPFVIQQRHKAEQQADDEGVDIARWVDLLIGVVPSINLEWIQKINHDERSHNRDPNRVVKTILRRMPDYVNYIVPQFSLTDINFQRVPLVDTSNPFIATTIPSQTESMVVIRFRQPNKFDFPFLLEKIPESFMSRPNTLVTAGDNMDLAMEIICEPLVLELVERKRKSLLGRVIK